MGNWTVADDGLSVFQSINVGDPSLYMSDQELVGSEIGVDLEVQTSGDDDFVGFALGIEPGDAENDDADYLLLDWKQRTQTWNRWSCGGGQARRGLAVSRVQGVPSDGEFWTHDDVCPTTDGSITELARAETLGDTGWNDHTPYEFRISLTPSRLRIWVNGSLEFDITDDLPTGGRLAFYNFSQSSVSYSGFQLLGRSAVEGAETDFDASFLDAGALDTHTGLWSWGDGTPVDSVDVDQDSGEGDVLATHTSRAGRHLRERAVPHRRRRRRAVRALEVTVENAPPVVDAGRTGTRAPDWSSPTRSSRTRVLDTHTATVDWGDGSPVEAADVVEEQGEGVVSAAHTYAVDGVYPVEVCVTDDAGAAACDSFEATVAAVNRSPLSEGEDDTTAVEGDQVLRQIAFTDANPTDVHSISIDWGEGASPASVEFQDGGAVGVGSAVHTYRVRRRVPGRVPGVRRPRPLRGPREHRHRHQRPTGHRPPRGLR
ncbi:MAG: PKD domain-containing protein [Acidimicrobiia bacterium]|nr:PKD domain-containing protein [Acidimicrobiia bacterium]